MRKPLKPYRWMNRTDIKATIEGFPTEKWVLPLMMVSGGISHGVIYELFLGQVDFTKDPTRIMMTKKMTGHTYVTFISKEATFLLKQHIAKSKITKSDEKIFVWNPDSILRLWRAALKQAGLEAIPIKALRKFFYIKARIKNPLCADLLVGHIIGAVRNPEFSIDIPILENFYRELEPEVSNFL